MTELNAFVKPLAEFSSLSLTEKVKVFAWYLHEVKGLERFTGTAINECFDAMHLSKPTNVSSLLNSLASGSTKRVLRDSKGYRLASGTREEMAALLPRRASAVATTVLLQGLETRVTVAHQRTFLAETMACFNHGAFRAAIVMAWNLAYSHVCDHIIDSELGKFNAQLKIVRPKLDPILKLSDFEDLKESLVLEVARGAGILSAASAKTMSEKLSKRNTAAHPSSTVVKSVTAEEVIHDLVENIVLRPTL